MHILVYRKHYDPCLWYDLFYHMAGEEDLNVSFGDGVTAADLAMGDLLMMMRLRLCRVYLEARHLYRLDNIREINKNDQYFKMKDVFESFCVKGLSKALLPALGLHNIHSTLYPGAPSFFTPLFVAVLANDQRFLKALISKGADPSSQPPAPEGNYGLLHLAARLGHHSLIRVLVKAGCPVNANAHPYGTSRTPLAIAAHYGNLACVKALANSPGFDLKSSKGDNALSAAAQQGQFHVIPTLVKLGCSVDDSPHSNLITPLHVAAMGDHAGAVETLLRLGANPFSVSSRGGTALHLAAEHGSSDVIPILVQAGLSPYYDADCIGKQSSPFHTAALYGALNVLKAFINSNCPIPSSSEDSLLHYALGVRHYPKPNSSMSLVLSKRISIRFLAELVELGCSVTTTDQTSEAGSLPIHYASHHNDPAVIQLLINLGCPMNAFTRSKEGSRLTPMQVAAGDNSVQAIRVLAANGCNVDFHHPLEDPPLHVAVRSGSMEAVRALLELGARVTLRNQSGSLPMHTAIVSNQIEMIKILFQYGASVTDAHQSSEGQAQVPVDDEDAKCMEELFKYGATYAYIPFSEISSPAEKAARVLIKHLNKLRHGTMDICPLSLAVYNHNRAAARKLIELGANVDAMPMSDFNPLRLACILGLADIAGDLIDFGASCDILQDGEFLPLHTAIKYNHSSVVQTLINKGCDPTVPTIVRGKPDLTPFQLACIMRCPEILQILHKLVPNIHQLTPDHLSPLHLAILEPGIGRTSHNGSVTVQPLKINAVRQEETVKLLLKYGCNVNATAWDLTPLDFAVHYELKDIVFLLVKAGGERGDKITDREEMRKRIEFFEGRVATLSLKVDKMEARIQTLEDEVKSESIPNHPKCTCHLDIDTQLGKYFNVHFLYVFVYVHVCMYMCVCVSGCVCLCIYLRMCVPPYIALCRHVQLQCVFLFVIVFYLL